MGFLVQFDAPALATSSDQVTRSFGVTFDGEDVFVTSEVGSATEAVIEGGPRGFRGLPGLDNYELWLREGNFGSYEDFTATYIGADGAPGPSGYIAWDEDTLSYPLRPIPGLPVTFVGPVSPLDLGVMIDGDVWNNTTAAPFADEVLVAVEDVDGLVAGHLSDENSLSYVQAKALSEEAVNSLGNLFREVRYRVQPNQVSVDEFQGTVFSNDWSRVEVSNPERAVWTQAGGFCSVAEGPVADVAALLHGLMRAGTLGIGESYETYMRLATGIGVSSPMIGLCVSNGITPGQGIQVSARFWTNNVSPNLSTMRTTNWNAEQTGGNNTPAIAGSSTPWHGSQTGIYIRLKRAADLVYESQWSLDGISWMRHNSHTVPTAFVPTHVGFWSSTWAAANYQVGSFDYLRKVLA